MNRMLAGVSIPPTAMMLLLIMMAVMMMIAFGVMVMTMMKSSFALIKTLIRF